VWPRALSAWPPSSNRATLARMAYGDALRSSWSVRHRADIGFADGVFEDLARSCCSICFEHLPRSSGYQHSLRRLSGPIDGYTITVRRGPFQGVVSLQRFRHQIARERHREIRMVAAARHEDQSIAVSRDVSLARFTLAGSAIGTTTLASLSAASAGAASSVALALLLVPTLMALRMFVAMRAVADAENRALEASPVEKARQQAYARSLARDRRRWQEALACLRTEQDLLMQRLGARPFRGLPPMMTPPPALVATKVA